MTQEDKELLLKDLCVRLPYGAFVQFEVDGQKTIKPLTVDFFSTTWYHTEYIKPYLRPISSMTEDEMDKLFNILHIDKEGKDEDWIKINDDLGIKFFFPTGKWVENVADAYDYLYSIHIDFRRLIHKNLALEAPKDMYKQ